MSKAKDFFDEREDEFESEFRGFLGASLPGVHPDSLDAVASYARFLVTRYREHLFRLLDDQCKED